MDPVISPTEPMEDSKRSWVGIISGLIGIITVLTAVQILPALLSKNSPNADAKWTGVELITFLLPAVILSQIAYLLFLYLCLRGTHKLAFRNRPFNPFSLKDLFWTILAFLIALSFSLAFAEGFWGPPQTWASSFSALLFLFGSVLADIFTVLVAFYHVD